MYHCVYCDTTHDEPATSPGLVKTVEHVIPDALLSRRLTLGDACAYWNNFFARSFERPVTSSPFVRRILLEFNPGPRNQEILLETVTTARGTTEHLYARGDGRFLRDPPRYEDEAHIECLALDPSNPALPDSVVRIPLPEELVFRGRAHVDDALFDKVRSRLEREVADRRPKIHAYLMEIARDASNRPDVAAILSGRRLRPPPAELPTLFSAERGSERMLVTDVLPPKYSGDAELLAKFYAKIAWCFACVHLGPQRLRALGGEVSLGYAKCDDVEPSLVDLCEAHNVKLAEALFRKETVAGRTVFFWRMRIDEAERLLPTLAPDLQPFVSIPLQRRSYRWNVYGSKLVHLDQPGKFENGGAAEEKRFHRLRLERRAQGEHAFLACTITLFGGAMAATVVVTTLVLAESFRFEPVEEVIRF